MSQSIGMISLGCAKNQVNAEQMLFLLRVAGYEILPDPDGADLVIINTCGFIEDAKAEAANIIARANKQAELEMKKAQDEIKKEIISVAALVAEKVVSDKIDIEIQDSLIDDTLKEIGEKTWQS